MYYNVELQEWGQAHIWASWVIFAAVREGDPSIISFEFTKKDDKDYFIMHVDRDKLRTTGHKALSDFLSKLHTYKSLGDYETAKEFFEHYSKVDEEMLKIR
jgi:dipeptidyl-peptidase-3